MKILLYIALLLCISANAQDIQVTGKLLNRETDTVHVQAWYQGELMAEQYRTDPFYTLTLGMRPYYDIVLTCGSKQKTCFLNTWNMTFELLQIDIDFQNKQSVSVYKEKKNSNTYTFIYYGFGSVRQREVKIYETN